MACLDNTTCSFSTFQTFHNLLRYVDMDGDGKISAVELHLCLSTLDEESSLDEARQAVEAFDEDGDGLLGLEEFARLVEVEEERYEGLKEAFRVYAMDGIGRITPGSLRRALNVLGIYKSFEECKDIISRFDLDGDGMLSFEEFIVMMH